jgi:hypothetical protein
VANTGFGTLEDFRSFKHHCFRLEEQTVQCNIKRLCVVTALLVATSGFAYAQGGSTDKNGNAIGSEHVSSTGNTAKTMHKTSHHSSKARKHHSSQ